MVQSSMVGVFFAVGLVCGLVISFMVTNYATNSGGASLFKASKELQMNMHKPMATKLSALDAGEDTIVDDRRTVTDSPSTGKDEEEFNRQPMSHDDMDKIHGPKDVIDLEQKDKHVHHGNPS